jgi:uncharacterized glyoxalase superfamily protein PhnB
MRHHPISFHPLFDYWPSRLCDLRPFCALHSSGLESNNVGVFLRNSRWGWEKPRRSGEQLGLGMYPHFEVSDAAATVEKARQAGYRIIQEPKKYDFGTEAFNADPDGYIWAFVSRRFRPLKQLGA